MWIKYSKYIIPLGAFCIGALLVWGSFHFFPSTANHRQVCSQRYPFISKGIDCETIDEKVNRIENLHSDISAIVEKEKASHHITRASVFYRDLNTRRWFGVNDIDKFYPASLIKLPIAVMYYKIAELEPEIFDKKLQIPADAGDNSDQHYPPANPMVPGQYYTVREMIRHMLVYSDNAPFTPLADSAGLFREKVLSDLNIYEPPAGEGEGAWSVTARNYGNIFRMLYNASYLNIDYANEMLGILSESTFQKGIVAGVPDGVKVAHKFGEAAGTDKDGKVLSLVLNDCGIVYKPNAPYILCTMTEGTDYPQMEKVIKEIAKESYDALE